MADTLLKGGQITTPQHYFEVLTTGQLDSLYEHDMSQIMLIRSENEDLADGKSPTAVLTDQHKLHIKEHATVLDSPEARTDPTIVQSVTQHIQKHIDLLKTTSPEILGMLGEQSLAPQQGPPQGGPPPGPPPRPMAPGPAAPQMMNATQPVVQAANGVKHPKMPELPKNTPGASQDAYAQMQANQIK